MYRITYTQCCKSVQTPALMVALASRRKHSNHVPNCVNTYHYITKSTRPSHRMRHGIGLVTRLLSKTSVVHVQLTTKVSLQWHNVLATALVSRELSLEGLQFRILNRFTIIPVSWSFYGSDKNGGNFYSHRPSYNPAFKQLGR